jgi:hypothetical protein
MTKRRDKNMERLYVEFCASRLGAAWTIAEGEAPDFLITDEAHTFGLEVTRAFTDSSDAPGGSEVRRAEGAAVRRMARILREVEERTSIVISASFSRRPGVADQAEIVDRLVALNLQALPLGGRAELTLANGLKVRTQHALHHIWRIDSDSVGWVGRQGHVPLQQCIAAKSPGTKSYSGPGALDLRLLVVADATSNSGKLRVDAGAAIDPMGFTRVYFAAYPLEVLTFPRD